MIFGRIAAAHAFLAQRQALDVDTGEIVGSGRQLDGIARSHLRQRVVQRAAGVMIVVAVARVLARRSDEARADHVVVTAHDAGRQQPGREQDHGTDGLFAHCPSLENKLHG